MVGKKVNFLELAADQVGVCCESCKSWFSNCHPWTAGDECPVCWCETCVGVCVAEGCDNCGEVSHKLEVVDFHPDTRLQPGEWEMWCHSCILTSRIAEDF